MSSQARKTMRFKSWGLLAISYILPSLMIDSVLNSAHAAEQNAGSQPDLGLCCKNLVRTKKPCFREFRLCNYSEDSVDEENSLFDGSPRNS